MRNCKESVRCFEYNGNVNRDNVIIFGIPTTGQINGLYDTNDAYNQIDFQEDIMIPEVKPDVEQILNANLRVCLDDAWVSPSGFKIFIKGQLCQKITYTACQSDQPVHTVEKTVPFSQYIDLRQFGLGPVIGIDPFDIVTLAPEDAFLEIINGRHIFKNVIIAAFIDLPGLLDA